LKHVSASGNRIPETAFRPHHSSRRIELIREAIPVGSRHALPCAVVSEAKLPLELRNRLVHFRIADAHIPEPVKLLQDLYGSHLLQGRVREISKDARETFVVVDVDGISTPVIVALDRILGVL
jgi:hypothetical protein